MDTPVVTRFAPSPTGLLHLGHAYSALVGRALGERWLLRIEDIDRGRCRAEFVGAIHADLAWLGLEPDGMLVQSSRLADHAAAVEALRRRRLLYPCTCSRADIGRAAAAPHAGETVRYPGTCRGRRDPPAGGAAYAWRLDLAATGLPMEQEWAEGGLTRTGRADLAGDPVLARKDIPTSYHLACVLDDAHQGVTLVTRGADLRAATDLHRLLQGLFGWPAPAYAHHALLCGPDGRRLAKRDGAASLRALRAAGRRPAEVRALAGWPD